MMRWLLLTLVLALTAGVALADDTYYRQVQTQEPGKWVWNGYSWQWQAGVSRTLYVPAKPPVTVKTKTVYKAPAYNPPAFAPGWKEKALDLAKQRDEYMSYLKTLDVLGFHGQPYAYGMTSWLGNAMTQQAGGYSYGGSAYASTSSVIGSYGVQGNTLYGYPVGSLKDLYGSTDLNALYQQSARLTQNAQSLAGQANTEFGTLVGQAGTSAARVAEILARSEAAARALNAARGDPQSTTKTVQTTAGAAPLMPRADGGVADAKAFLQAVGVPRCGGCHGAKDAKGSFNVLNYPAMPRAAQLRVYARLVTDDPARLMPRGADGAGHYLPAAELARFAEQINAQ